MARAPELIADHGVSGMTGVDFLARTDAMHPLAKPVPGGQGPRYAGRLSAGLA